MDLEVFLDLVLGLIFVSDLLCSAEKQSLTGH